MPIVTTIQRARARLPLTPGERALLKLGQGLALAALMAALVTAGHALEGSGPVDWRRIAFAAGVAALVAILNALAKYFTAQGDVPLADALALLATEAAQHAPIPAPTASARANAATMTTTTGSSAVPGANAAKTLVTTPSAQMVS